jgi:hypothetical protein
MDFLKTKKFISFTDLSSSMAGYQALGEASAQYLQPDADRESREVGAHTIAEALRTRQAALLQLVTDPGRGCTFSTRERLQISSNPCAHGKHSSPLQVQLLQDWLISADESRRAPGTSLLADVSSCLSAEHWARGLELWQPLHTNQGVCNLLFRWWTS